MLRAEGTSKEFHCAAGKLLIQFAFPKILSFMDFSGKPRGRFAVEELGHWASP
jgi:hypothetical protein